MKNKNLIEIEVERERNDDIWDYWATAKRDGLTGYGSGYLESTAVERAKTSLIKQEQNLSPVSTNWENTPESFLVRN